jgi:hypothetical protein
VALALPLVPPGIIRAQVRDPARSWLVQLILKTAKEQGVDPCDAVALASRETNLHNEPGDFEPGHGPHGFGPMQLDDRSHVIPAGWEEHPGEILAVCCRLHRDNLTWAKRWFGWTGNPQKVAFSAYNCGRANAAAGALLGDSDRRTTDRNYGRDVLERAAVIRKLLPA